MKTQVTVRARGFTLIETIAVLVVGSLLVAFAGLLLAPMVGGFLDVRRNEETVQQTQYAMARFVRELTTVTRVASGSVSSLSYTMLDEDGTEHSRTLAWGGTPGAPLTLNGQVLLGSVRSFSLAYLATPHDTAPATAWSGTDSGIAVRLRLDDRITYTNCFYPRNL